MRFILLSLVFIHSAFALIQSPQEAMKAHFSNITTVEQDSMILTKKEQHKVEMLAKVKLNSKLFRIYTAKNKMDTVGYGILLTKKIRTKSAAILYIIDTKGALQSIEIIAFNEPRDYLPSPRWLAQFNPNALQPHLLKETITPISGATLSANAVVKVANIAHAIWLFKLKQ